MKYTTLMLTFILGVKISAQPTVQLFAYAQNFTPGMVTQREIPAENGEAPVKKPSSTTRYSIYIATSPSTQLKIIQVWLQGKTFSIAKAGRVKTPVRIKAPKPKTLIAATSKKIISIQLGQPLSGNNDTTLPSKWQHGYDVVVQYSWKNKVYHCGLTTITQLEPVKAQ